jgi:DNA (cytosine-5)-methyltransferase 1
MDDKYKTKLKMIHESSKSLIKENVDSHPALSAVNSIVNDSDKSKGVFTVLITCLLEKTINPAQDIRRHQIQIPGGFSGRNLDKKTVTPFLKEVEFPHMQESGWLTRSLEQPHPYDLNYPGKIQGDHIKKAFLNLLDLVENKKLDSESLLQLIFNLSIKRGACLIKEYNSPFSQAEKEKLTAKDVFNIVISHIEESKEQGSSKLPVLATYSVLSEIIKVVDKYTDKTLLPLKSHTASDKNSKSFGDIEIINEENKQLFESFEIKHLISLSPDIIKNCFEKIKDIPIKTYYIFSTEKRIPVESFDLISKLKEDYGFDFFIFNVQDYFLAQLTNVTNVVDVLNCYSKLVVKDSEILEIHKPT